MVGWRFIVSLSFVASLVGCSSAEEGREQGRSDVLVIRGATLIDGTGREPQDDSVVVAREDRIEAVTDLDGSYPADARVIEASGKYLLPGLIDAHAHIAHPNGVGLSDEQKRIATENNPKAFLYNGVTTVINLSSDPEWILEHRRLAREGKIVSPRIFTGGHHFTAPGGWGARHGGAVSSRKEIENRLNEFAARDFDLVKVIYEDGLGPSEVFPRLDRELMAVVAEKCKEHGIPLMIHAMDREEYRDAVEVDPRAIVHILEDRLPTGDSLPEEIASKGIFVTPTLVLFESFFDFQDHPERWEDPALRASVPDFVLESVRDETNLQKAIAGMNNILKMDALEWAREKLPIMKENTKMFFDAGIPLTVGTDSGGAVIHAFQGYNTPREIELLVDSGLTPMEAIVAGTRNGAMMMGAERDLGTVEAGKLADMILLNRNPLEDVAYLRDIELVIQGGRVFTRDELAFDADVYATEN